MYAYIACDCYIIEWIKFLILISHIFADVLINGFIYAPFAIIMAEIWSIN